MYDASNASGNAKNGESAGNAFGKPIIPVLLGVLACIAVFAFWFVKGAQRGVTNDPQGKSAIPTNAGTYPTASAANTAVGAQAAAPQTAAPATIALPTGAGRNETAPPASTSNGVDNVSGAQH